MALWSGLGGDNLACNAEEKPKNPNEPSRTGGSRGKRPKRLSNGVRHARRESLRDCTNRLTASYNASRKEGYVPPYPWYCPKLPLLERRCRADQRREELLQLLHPEEDGEPDQIEDLVTEWVSLLVERDKLLHQQVNKDIRSDYFCELHQLLLAQPSLGDTSEERNMKEVLMDLERCVSDYCSKERNTPTAAKRQDEKPVFFHSPPHVPGGPRETQGAGHQLDQETGQASVPTENVPTQQGAGGAPTLKNLPPPAPTNAPPSRPTLPSSTIPPSPSPAYQGTIGPTHRIMPGGAAGTMQFASNPIPAPRKKRQLNLGKDEPDLPVLRKEDHKNLLDEISSMGHAVLKHTNRPRSPGGTPMKVSHANPPPVGNNSDMLQRALMSKFRSLHSTPLHHSRFAHQDYGSSMDFSNAWSDINTSQVYEDPDISASSLSGLASEQNSRIGSSKINTAHNSSSAV